MTGTILKNYSRYIVMPDFSVVNKATEKTLTPEGDQDKQSYRLTNDKGERKRVYVADIKKLLEPQPEEKKEAKASTRKSKLTPEQITEIRNRIAAGEKQSVLAREYGVHQSTISEIKSNKLHKNEQ